MPQISNEMWGPSTRRGILSTTLLSYVQMVLRNLDEVDNVNCTLKDIENRNIPVTREGSDQ